MRNRVACRRAEHRRARGDQRAGTRSAGQGRPQARLFQRRHDARVGIKTEKARAHDQLERLAAEQRGQRRWMRFVRGGVQHACRRIAHRARDCPIPPVRRLTSPVAPWKMRNMNVAISLILHVLGAILWVGGHDVLAGRRTPGELSAFVFYAAIVAGAVGALSETWGELQRAAGGDIERIGVAVLVLAAVVVEVEAAVRAKAVAVVDAGEVAVLVAVQAEGEGVAVVGTQALHAEVRLFERLFTADQPDAGGSDFREALNPQSRRVVQAVLVPSLAQVQADDKFQFERHGYFVADRMDHRADRPVFNRITPLKDSFSK